MVQLLTWVELKSVSEKCGGLSVMMFGIMMMLVLSVDKLVSPDLVNSI